MYSSSSPSYTSSAAVPLPSVKIQMAVPTRSGSAAASKRRAGAGDVGNVTVANSIQALQRCCDLQSRRQKQQEEQEAAAAAVLNRSRSTSPLPGASPSSSAYGLGSRKPQNDFGSSQQLHGSNPSASGIFNPPSASATPAKQNQLLQQVLMSQAVVDKKALLEKRYHTGYSAFEFALETAMHRLERLKQESACGDDAGGGGGSTKKKVSIAAGVSDAAAAAVEDRWRILANCLTSASLNVDLHKICADIETTIDELAKYRAHQAAKAAGGGNSAVFALLNSKKKEQQAKNRLNGMQTAMAAMLLEQTLAAVGDAAPYAKPAMQWVLDTVLGSIYVSYDIVRTDLSRSFEPLHLAGDDDEGAASREDPSLGGGLLSTSANKMISGSVGSVVGASGGGSNFMSNGNAEKLISRFYGKTFFQSVRSLSATAAAHAEHAEEIERAKTRQSRVLERATSYWARYSMRRVLGAWRGFAKNEKIERGLIEQVEDLSKQNRFLKELNDQRERELSLSSLGSIAGSSQEALQLQVRELQRALEFERRRATRAEAALAVRIVEEGGGGGGGESSGGSPHGEGSSGSFGSPTVDITGLRAEVAHYRAVAVEACRLGDIDLHELERAVSAQTNVLARGMH